MSDRRDLQPPEGEAADIIQFDERSVAADWRVTFRNRVWLWDVTPRPVKFLALSARFPTVSLAKIHKIIASYLENQSSVDEYVAHYRQELADLERQNPTLVTTQMLRDRLAQLHAHATEPQRSPRALRVAPPPPSLTAHR